MVTFVILLLVAGCIILALYYLQARYDVRLSSWLNSEHNWSPDDKTPDDEFAIWLCCNHCFTEDGELSHDRSIFDNHTVPCNEEFCSQAKVN